MMASRERSDSAVTVADSQSPACTGIDPYGVDGDIADSLAVSKVLPSGPSITSSQKNKEWLRTNVSPHLAPS